MSGVTFQWPEMFALLLGVPVLIWLMGRARKKRQLVRSIWGQGDRSAIGGNRELFWILCFATLVVALARPGYDPVRRSISNTGRDVVFVLDVSRSMLARDTYPSRLESAKQGIEDCLDGFGSEQVGLVIYGGSSTISCPLTTDYGFVRYMLSQVQPRSVDFGGTFLLSAIEKVNDQVLDSDRAGFQDIVILTDGEDHAPNLDQVIDRVQESGVDLLILGLGSSETGAPIPVKKEDGSEAALSFEGETVYTVQQKDALLDLARQCLGSEYVNAGTVPYHLGEIYQRFSEGKEKSAMDGDSGYTVYREGAFFLIPLALIFAALAHPTYWRGAFRFVVVLAFLGLGLESESYGQESDFSFESASISFEEGRYDEARMAFAWLHDQANDTATHAALSFNLGLVAWKQSDAQREQSPRDALAYAMQAREAFLLAARESPDFRRAKLRLSQLVQVIDELEKIVADEEEREQEQNDAMQELLERIEALLQAQKELRAENVLADPIRSMKRRGKPANDQEGNLEPANAEQLSLSFSSSQERLAFEGESIQKMMRELDSLLSEKAEPGANVETLLATPLGLIQKAIDGQEAAGELFELWQNWPMARNRQEAVEKRLQEILDLFASSDSEEGDEGDWDEYEDYEMGDEGEGMPSSMAMDGDLKADAQMQALPVPNYSAEEILSEEMGSQQFRQEQRAKANAGKVKKDW